MYISDIDFHQVKVQSINFLVYKQLGRHHERLPWVNCEDLKNKNLIKKFNLSKYYLTPASFDRLYALEMVK